MILPDFLSYFPRQLSVCNCCGCACPCGMIGAFMERLARRDYANVLLRMTPGHLFLPCPLPHAQNWRLTHNLNPLQSP